MKKSRKGEGKSNSVDNKKDSRSTANSTAVDNEDVNSGFASYLRSESGL